MGLKSITGRAKRKDAGVPRGRTGATLPCRICGKAMYLYPSLSMARKYCGVACRSIGQKKTLDVTGAMKRCAMCKQFKPLPSFQIAKIGTARRIQAYCVPCGVQKNREWRDANPARAKVIREAYYQRHQAEILEKKRALTPEQRAIKNGKARDYRRKNMSKVLMWNKLRVHRLRAGGPTPHPRAIAELLRQQNAQCVYCHKVLVRIHLDHKLPVSRGGNNSIHNLQLLCPTCNMRKGKSTHEEYLRRMDLLAMTIQQVLKPF